MVSIDEFIAWKLQRVHSNIRSIVSLGTERENVLANKERKNAKEKDTTQAEKY
jgi:hypothetical protein